jgi:RHS repeat-associated protein
VPTTNYFAPWIEQLWRDGITGGCAGGNFCPTGTITRGQMTVFLKTTFGLTDGAGNLKPGATFAYHSNGMLREIKHDNGVVDAHTLRSDNHMLGRIRVSGTGANFDSGTYEYDASGNITRAGTDYYLYDKVGRLKEASVGYIRAGNNRVRAYEYDSFGNLKKITPSTNGTAGTVTNIAVNSATNRLNATGTVYDESGGLTAWTTPGGMANTSTNDALGMARSLTVNGVTSYYFYNANDERVWVQKSATTNGVTTTESDYTLRGAGNQVVRRFKTTGPNGSETWDSYEDYVQGAGKLIASTTSGSTNHYHADHLGSTRVVTNQTRGAAARHDYFPFGEEATNLAQSTQAFRFTGHERDFNSTLSTLSSSTENLDYMHARYYSPVLGRFLSTDPHLDVKRAMSNPQSWNRYSYVENKPMILTDPTGRKVQATFDVSSGTLTVIDVEKGTKLVIKNVFSGSGQHRNIVASKHVKNEGPTPTGKYLIGKGYDSNHGGNDRWYRLYGNDGTGKYRYQQPGTAVKAPDGSTVYRDGMNLHTGLVSLGCVTVPSDIPNTEDNYPQSKQYDQLIKMLDSTKPMEYNGSEFSGWLTVQE